MGMLDMIIKKAWSDHQNSIDDDETSKFMAMLDMIIKKALPDHDNSIDDDETSKFMDKIGLTPPLH